MDFEQNQTITKPKYKSLFVANFVQGSGQKWSVLTHFVIAQ